MKVLIFSASIGEGHDLPARVLADGIERGGAGDRGRDRRLAGAGRPARAPARPGQLALSLQVGKPALRPLLQADHRRAADTLVRGEADPVAGRQADQAGGPRTGARRRGLDLSGEHRGARRPPGQGKDRRAGRLGDHRPRGAALLGAPRRRPSPDHPPRVGRGGPPDRPRHGRRLRSRSHRRALLRPARSGRRRAATSVCRRRGRS